MQGLAHGKAFAVRIMVLASRLVSGKLGNLTGQGVNIGAKRLRQAAIDMAKRNMEVNRFII
jgi:hypothetical protein